MTRRVRAWIAIAFSLSLVPLAACGMPPPYPGGLRSSDPTVRIQAIKVAGERRDRSVLPLLVQQLDDADEAVRLYAILALDKITGTRLGYDYSKPAPERARAVKRWRNYVQTAQKPATQPTSAPATGQGGGP